ncbi:MAG: Gfo/Idh/MocA family oxidoreductase [Gemmatimonadetes bacterium]|nr:Gfo/Idh/MocA family oxidoreductase [Gemmatimonadota bacterium]
MTRAPLAIGIVGCGAIVQSAHLPVLLASDDARITAIADSRADALDATRARVPHARAFPSAEALLAEGEVDAVVVAAPTALHADLAVAVLDSRRHLYLEKPIATSAADGRRVLDAWRRAGSIGVVGYNYRRNPLLQSAATSLRRGDVGRTVAFRTVFSTCFHAGGSSATWRHARTSGGGALLDLASHHIDLIRFLSGAEVVRTFARIRSHHSEDDTALLVLELSDGTTADLFVSLSSTESDRVEIYGEKGRIVVDRHRESSVVREPLRAHRAPTDYASSLVARVRGLPYALARRRAPAHEPSFAHTMQDFVAACRANRPMSPDLADGFASLAVVLAAEESSRTGRAVDVAPSIT